MNTRIRLRDGCMIQHLLMLNFIFHLSAKYPLPFSVSGSALLYLFSSLAIVVSEWEDSFKGGIFGDGHYNCSDPYLNSS